VATLASCPPGRTAASGNALGRTAESELRPERRRNSDLSEVVGSLCRFTTPVVGVKTPSVPVLRQAPQGGEIEDCPDGFVSPSRPLLDARERAEDALVLTRGNDVVPCPRRRNGETDELVALGRACRFDDPCQSAVACRTRCRDHNARFVRHQVRDREGIPRAPAPIEGSRAQHTEAEVRLGEGVRHDDLTRVIEHHKSGSCQALHRGVDGTQVDTELSGDVVTTGSSTGLSERSIDDQSHALDTSSEIVGGHAADGNEEGATTA